MAQGRNIILVGFMATGKSQVGKLLSRKLGRPLADADEEIVRRRGKPVHRIFQEEGEAVFRSLERAVIADLCGQSGKIIAAGGGAFVDPENRSLMLKSGMVFCLSASPEIIYSRIGRQSEPGGAARPLLAGGDPLGRIKALLEQRAGAYAQAHYVIQTDALTPEEVADRVLELCSLDNES